MLNGTKEDLNKRKGAIRYCGCWGPYWEECPFLDNPVSVDIFCKLFHTKQGKPRKLRITPSGETNCCKECMETGYGQARK